MMFRELNERYYALLERLGVKDQDLRAEYFYDLIDKYSQPYRAYHNISHIARCLSLFDLIPEGTTRYPDELEFAIFYHDIFHFPWSGKNEELSAEYAEWIAAYNLNIQTYSTIGYIINSTKKHGGGSMAADLMCDIDLSILGAPPDEFAIYNQQIKEEYTEVFPITLYRAERLEVMNKFYNRTIRGGLFKTILFADMFQEQAKENLTKLLY